MRSLTTTHNNLLHEDLQEGLWHFSYPRQWRISNMHIRESQGGIPDTTLNVNECRLILSFLIVSVNYLPSVFQICAAIYRLLLYMVFTSRNWFVVQGPVAIILISWNVIFIWETGYWTRTMKRFALFDLLKSLYSDTKILSKYIPSLQRR
jgi:hypothetical protein